MSWPTRADKNPCLLASLLKDLLGKHRLESEKINKTSLSSFIRALAPPTLAVGVCVFLLLDRMGLVAFHLAATGIGDTQELVFVLLLGALGVSILLSIERRVFGMMNRCRKELRTALPESDERCPLAGVCSEDTCFVQDLELRYTCVENLPSPLRPADILGRTDRDMFPAEEAALLDEMKMSVLTTAESSSLETCLHFGEGAFFVQVLVEPQRSEDGRIVGVFGRIKDIDEWVRMEQSLQEANGKLAGWVDNLEVRIRQGVVLTEMGESLQMCFSAEEAYSIIGLAAGRLFPDDAGGLFVLDAARGLVQAMVTWGNDLGSELSFPLDACQALRMGYAYAVDDSASAELPCGHIDGSVPGSYLCIPMMAQGEMLGILYLRYTSGIGIESDPILELHDEYKRQLALRLADYSALALANLNLQHMLREQAIRDPLTNLFNRRHMEETLEREVRGAERRQTSLGIIMLDIDHFKMVNDIFGHEAGDTVLRQFGAVLRANTRAEDIACRYGGEEFTVILPSATVPVTAQRAEQFRQAIGCLNIEYDGRLLGPVTASFGVATFPDNGFNGEAVLQAADEALYLAKVNGRNRVELAQGCRRPKLFAVKPIADESALPDV